MRANYSRFCAHSKIIKSSKKWNFTTFKTRKAMNLFIWSRSRCSIMTWIQVWVFVIKILCRIRISGQFGRVGSDLEFTRQSMPLLPWIITRDCGEISHLELDIAFYPEVIQHTTPCLHQKETHTKGMECILF